MPGQPSKCCKVHSARLDQRLGLGHHLDHGAVVEQQRVIGAKPHRFGEVELDAGAFDAEHEALARLALRVGQDQRVEDGGALPLGGWYNACGAGHAMIQEMRAGAAPQLRRFGRSGSSVGRNGGASGDGGAAGLDADAPAETAMVSLRWYSR